MGIESDKVVYEYLSRVGDVAQQRQLPSATRMRLVSQLRDEIDRRRAKAVVDSPAAVRRILDRIGSPDDVVDAARDTAPASATAPQPPSTAVPVQPTQPAQSARPAQPARQKGRREQASEAERPPKGLRRVVPRPRPRPAEPDAAPQPPAVAPGALPPHRAGMDELGDSATQPDWWRVDDSPFGVGDGVPGFVGGVEVPDLLKPPPKDADAPEDAREDASDPAPKEAPEQATGGPTPEAEPAVRRRRLLPSVPSPGAWNNPLLLLAAGLLVTGAVLGNLIALAAGWAIAYVSRRLTRTEIKLAVVVLPALALGAGFGWLWGRMNGRWGDPIAEGGMSAAIGETWPWVVRGAALASALFLVWRSQRER